MLKARTVRRRGFTLMEVVLVIVLIGVIVAFGWPDFETSTRSEELAESSRRIKAAIAMCRAQAMNEARRYRLAVRPSGEVRITAQRDPITAPHEYGHVGHDWVNIPLLLETVWVEAVQSLPVGPPPLDLGDDELVTDAGTIEFDDFAAEPIAITALEAPFEVDFLPDGSSTSARWVLRDARGRGIKITLDGRLGRVSAEMIDVLSEGEAKRPELPAEKEAEPAPSGADEKERGK